MKRRGIQPPSQRKASLVNFEIEPHVRHDGRLLGLHAGQKKAWASLKRFVGVFAGWQSGKTVLGSYWLLREMQRRGPGDYAIIVPNFPILRNKALPELKVAFSGIGRYRSNDQEFDITSTGMAALGWNAGGRVLIRHAENEDAIEAFTAKAIWIDEPGQIDDVMWTSIQPRGAVHNARFLFTSRPYTHNWYVREIWGAVMDRKGRPKPDADPDTEVINFRSIDNPSFPPAEYYRQKARLPDWEFAMKYDGIPTRPAGAIYDCFVNDPEEFDLSGDSNVCYPFEIPTHWPVEIGSDFGNVNTAAVACATEMTLGPIVVPTGRYFFFLVYKKAGRTNEEHAWGLRAMSCGLTAQFEAAYDEWRQNRERVNRKPGETPPECIAEVLAACYLHPNAIGGSHQEQGWRDAYSLGGLKISEPKVRDVEVGISCGYAGFKGRNAVVFSTLGDFISQIENYSRKLDDELEATEEIIEKAKQHFCDAYRYLATKLWPPKQGKKDIAVEFS